MMEATPQCTCRKDIYVKIIALFVLIFCFGLPCTVFIVLAILVFEDLFWFYVNRPRPFLGVEDFMDSFMAQVSRPNIEFSDVIEVIREGWVAIAETDLLKPCECGPPSEEAHDESDTAVRSINPVMDDSATTD